MRRWFVVYVGGCRKLALEGVETKDDILRQTFDGFTGVNISAALMCAVRIYLQVLPNEPAQDTRYSSCVFEASMTCRFRSKTKLLANVTKHDACTSTVVLSKRTL